MLKRILLGRGHQILPTSSAEWEQNLAIFPQESTSRLSFMTEIHHHIRNFVVSELVKRQSPVTPKQISMALDIPTREVETILEELENKLFFVVRNGIGEVIWAFPFTVEPTAHSLEFSTGERLFAA